MKKFILFLILFKSTISFSQKFVDAVGNQIDFDSKYISLNLDDFNYSGIFEGVFSKIDGAEYLIYSSRARIVVLKLNEKLNIIKKTSVELKIESIKIIHSREFKKIKKELAKKGLINLKNFVVVYDRANNYEINYNDNTYFCEGIFFKNNYSSSF